MTENPHDPTEGDLLAPWRAVDRLDAEDDAAFERLMREDPSLARRLDVAVEERDATVDLNETLPSPSAAVREALFARIEAEQAMGAPGKDFGRWLATKFAGLSPSTLGWAAATAALVIAMQAGLLVTGALKDAPGGHVVASGGGGLTAAGQRALIAFAPAATAEQIAALLRDAHAEIVGGPKPGGVFVIRLADQPMAEAELGAALDALRKQTGVVRFAVPEQAGR